MRSTGAVIDRPWGLTLATLGTQGFTGLLTLTAEGKQYSISFDLGRIVGATSPLASDAAVRLALTNHLVSSSQTTELNRQIIAAKDRDELEVLAELAGLTPSHVAKLRHRLAAQRSARTFALDTGTYVAEERIAMPAGADLDVREVVYLGARMNLSEQRLAVALRRFGSVFAIRQDALSSLETFGFATDEAPVLQSLRAGASMAQLEAAHRDVDPRMLQAIVYALAACGACHIERSPTNPGNVVEYDSGPEATPRTTTSTQGATYFVSRTQTNRTPVSDPAVARTASGRPVGPETWTQTSGPDAARIEPDPVASRTQTSELAVARTSSGRPSGPAVARTSTARRTQALVAARMILVEQGADYFTLLGVPFDAPTDVVQTAYLNLVRQLHPDKLAELGVVDESGSAQRVFHQVGLAFTVLTDPARRAIYLEKLGKPSALATVEMTARTRTADGIAASPAGDAFRRGESALRGDEPAEAVVEFGRACALEPNNVDFHAMLGWAQFCAARDKVTIAPETRKALDRAVQRSAKPTQARFLLGRVERMLGRDREALRHFQEVVDTSAHHPDAAAEIRAIEARLAKSGKR